MKEKKLVDIYSKYIDKPIYRVVSGRTFKNILKNRIEPGKDPYKEVNDKIRELAKIINKLEEKRFYIRVRNKIPASETNVLR